MDIMDVDSANADSPIDEPVDPIYQMLEDIIEISSTQPNEALTRAQTLLGLGKWIKLDALCLARIHESRAFSYYELEEWDRAKTAAELALTLEAKAEAYDSQTRIELKQMCREYTTALLGSVQNRVAKPADEEMASDEPAISGDAPADSHKVLGKRARSALTPAPSGVIEEEQVQVAPGEVAQLPDENKEHKKEHEAMVAPRTPPKSNIYEPPTPFTRDDRF